MDKFFVRDFAILCLQIPTLEQVTDLCKMLYVPWGADVNCSESKEILESWGSKVKVFVI